MVTEEDRERLKELEEKYKSPIQEDKGLSTSPMWLHLENTSEEIKTFYLFDFVSDKNKENDIDLSEIKIKCSFVDDIDANKGGSEGWKMAYKMFILICFKPFKVKKMRVLTDNELQLKEPIKYYSFTCNGHLSSFPTRPFLYKKDGQLQDCIVDVDMEFTLDSGKYLCVTILPKTQLRLTFF